MDEAYVPFHVQKKPRNPSAARSAHRCLWSCLYGKTWADKRVLDRPVPSILMSSQFPRNGEAMMGVEMNRVAPRKYDRQAPGTRPAKEVAVSRDDRAEATMPAPRSPRNRALDLPTPSSAHPARSAPAVHEGRVDKSDAASSAAVEEYVERLLPLMASELGYITLQGLPNMARDLDDLLEDLSRTHATVSDQERLEELQAHLDDVGAVVETQGVAFALTQDSQRFVDEAQRLVVGLDAEHRQFLSLSLLAGPRRAFSSTELFIIARLYEAEAGGLGDAARRLVEVQRRCQQLTARARLKERAGRSLASDQATEVSRAQRELFLRRILLHRFAPVQAGIIALQADGGTPMPAASRKIERLSVKLEERRRGMHQVAEVKDALRGLQENLAALIDKTGGASLREEGSPRAQRRPAARSTTNEGSRAESSSRRPCDIFREVRETKVKIAVASSLIFLTEEERVPHDVLLPTETLERVRSRLREVDLDPQAHVDPTDGVIERLGELERQAHALRQQAYSDDTLPGLIASTRTFQPELARMLRELTEIDSQIETSRRRHRSRIRAPIPAAGRRSSARPGWPTGPQPAEAAPLPTSEAASGSPLPPALPSVPASPGAAPLPLGPHLSFAPVDDQRPRLRPEVARPHPEISAEVVEAFWDRGTFRSRHESACYHFRKHARGLGVSFCAYTQQARQAMGLWDGFTVTRSLSDPNRLLRIVSQADCYLVFSADGRILSFRNRLAHAA